MSAADSMTVALAAGEVRVVPWPDALIDAMGHDPRSVYVERFWLGVLGPSTTWLLRLLAARLDDAPDGFSLSLTDAARALGLSGNGGRHSPFARSLGRAAHFGLLRIDRDEVAVRRRVPPLPRRYVVRLPESLQSEHALWQTSPGALGTGPEPLERRARRLALSLVELGEDVAATERQLGQWRFPPPLCREAARWAWARAAEGARSGDAA